MKTVGSIMPRMCTSALWSFAFAAALIIVCRGRMRARMIFHYRAHLFERRHRLNYALSIDVNPGAVGRRLIMGYLSMAAAVRLMLEGG